MDRPQHRRFILLGLALLAGSLLLAGRQWFSKSPEQAIATPAATVAVQPVETHADELKPPSPGATNFSAPPPKPAPAANTGGFRGKVVDAVTRRPIVEFEVRLIRRPRPTSEYRAEEPLMKTFQSDSGRFAWNDIPVDSWMVSVSARGYQPFNIAELKVVAGKTTREAVMPLLRGYAVRGRVFDLRTGAGIADAWIGFAEAPVWRGGYRQNASTKSQVDGAFVLDGVPGGDIKLTVAAQDHAYREVEIVVDEKTQPQEIALSNGGTIAGLVMTADGKPLKVMVMLDGPYVGYGREANDAGQFSFPHMPPGHYSLATMGAAGSARQEFDLGPDERKEDIVLTLATGRKVSGVVRGMTPEQLKQTSISLNPQANRGLFNARLDEQGGYVLNGVPPGRAQLAVYNRFRQVYKSVDIPPDRDLVFDVVFPPGARLSGRVTQGGKPIADKTVWAGPADRKDGVLYRARTSEEGEYEIEDLPPGDYRIRADEDISRPITIAGDAVLNLDIPLVQIGGRVQEDGSSVPVVGADIYIRGVDAATARVHAYKAADDFGEFRLTGIEPGEIVLTVYKPGYEMYREKIVYASPITKKTITLRKGGGVEVRAQRTASREPVRGFMMSEKVANNDWGINLWIPLDREGVGHLPSALAGSTLEIYGSGDEPIVIEEWDGQALELKL